MEYHFNPAVGRFRLGDHICLLYRSQQELLATLVPYVRLATERNEQCICIQSARISHQLLAALKRQGVQTGRHLQRGALALLDPKQAYLKSGRFDPEVMTKLLASCIRTGLRNGFSGLRLFGDMRWALDKKPGCNRLLEYETLMEQFFPMKPAMGLCAYSVKRFPAAKLRDVLTVHRFGLLKADHGTKRHTFRVQGGNYTGHVEFDGAAKGPFACEIRQASGSKHLSWSHEKSLATAIGSVKRQLRELRSTPH